MSKNTDTKPVNDYRSYLADFPEEEFVPPHRRSSDKSQSMNSENKNIHKWRYFDSKRGWVDFDHSANEIISRMDMLRDETSSIIEIQGIRHELILKRNCMKNSYTNEEVKIEVKK